MVGDIVIGRQEETARAAGRVGNGFHGLGLDAGHHGLDQSPWGKILPGAAFDIFGVFLQKAFINLALDVRAHDGPLLFVDHIDQLEELGRILNLVLAFGEYLPQDTLWCGTTPGARWCNGLPVRPRASR